MKTSGRKRSRRLLRWSVAIGLPLLLLPALWSKRVSAKRLASHTTVRGKSAGDRGAPPRLAVLQELVDRCRTELGIPEAVVVSLVPANPLVVSVERARSADRSFALSLEEPFLDELTDEEMKAVAAHELGHVWIFTHHPFLHTEELANEIAMRVVDRQLLEQVYEKVWERTGVRGELRYLPDKPPAL